MNNVKENVIFIILTFFMGICAILSIPYAFKEGGALFLIPIIFIIGLVYINNIRKKTDK